MNLNLGLKAVSHKQIINSVAGISFFIFLAFAIVYRKWTLESWSYPTGYKSDTLFTLFYTSLYGRGEFFPLGSKMVSFLNAPIGANLNDFPGNEDILFWFIGIFQRIFGLFLGGNLALVVTLILNGISFYFLLLYFGVRNSLATAGAIAIGNSHYFLLRGFEHFILTQAWHIPPMILVAHWLFESSTVWTSRKRWFAILFSVFTGFHFVYYTFITMQLFLLSAFRCIIQKKWLDLKWNLQLIAVCVLSLVLSQVDSIINRFKVGPNPQVLTRDLTSVEIYSLKMADLFLPFTHVWKQFQAWTHSIYYDKPFLIHTEPGYSYLGLVGGVAFLSLMISPLYAYFKNKKNENPDIIFFAYWILIYSISGGLNFLVSAVSGFYVFRCTNRYSIVLMMLSMLFVLVKCNFAFGKKVAYLIVLIVLLDLPARMTLQQYNEIKIQVDSDQEFVQRIEQILPAGAKIFQLPVTDFPEYPKVYNMTDYDHFRPALYTSRFNWSYGAMKGRSDNDWQKELEKKTIPEMVDILRQKGFSAIYLNKRGFEDGGQKLVGELLKILPNAQKISSDELTLVSIN